MPFFIVMVVVVVAFIFWAISIYNSLVRLRNLTKNSFSQIDVQLKRRYDLIPNLVETVKGAMSHEKETLEAVIQARNQALPALQAVSQNPADPTLMKNFIAADGGLSAALGRLMVVSEQYPNIKAIEAATSLMDELTSTENKIGFARQAYNDSVMEYNNQIEMFPNSLISRRYHFQSAVLWQIEKQPERENIKVSLK